jgi:hypothetical protein
MRYLVILTCVEAQHQPPSVWTYDAWSSARKKITRLQASANIPEEVSAFRVRPGRRPIRIVLRHPS